jgi:group I intron endonuclease
MEFKISDKDRRKSGIYKITNTVNGKFYIGSAASLRKRFTGHKHDLNNHVHDNEHLTRAYHKYGADKFTFECIEFVERSKLIEREQLFIDSMKACDPDIGYNICPTAGSTQGMKRTQESKDKMSRLHGRKVYQWSMEDGSLLQEYDSISFAAQAMGLNKGSIKCAAMGYNKHKHAGFIWSYEQVPSKTKGQNRGKVDPSIVDQISESKGTQVVQKDVDGNIVMTHKNARFAFLNTGIPAHGIRVSCRKNSVFRGFRWEYVGEVRNHGKVGENATRFGAKLSMDQLINLSRKSGPVAQYDLNMNLIKEHPSLIEAYIHTGISKRLISENCLYLKQSADGYIFRRKSLFDKKYKKFYRLDENFNILESFESVYHACDKYRLLTTSIYQSIRKKRKCGGFFWGN